MKAHILYFDFLDYEGKKWSVGGIQTYILNLASVFKENGYEVIIYQKSYMEGFEKLYNGIKVIGVPIELKCTSGRKIGKKLYLFAKDNIGDNDILVFGSDTLICKTYNVKTLAIQHGIFWDVPKKSKSNRLSYILHILIKIPSRLKIIKRVNSVDYLICVDCNFINWYRTFVPYNRIKLNYIPNFSKLNYRIEKNAHKIRIIFARRLVRYRGTYIFVDAISKIINEFKDEVEIIIAGKGPDREYMHSRLGSFHNVTFTSYVPEDSLKMHSNVDIAVIPTIGSEGTSLSLLEAMASKCAVICTNVGGMTNVVIDRFNGLMIDSNNSGELYQAIKELINNNSLRMKLANNAYDTIVSSFSFDIWRKKWNSLIKDLKED